MTHLPLFLRRPENASSFHICRNHLFVNRNKTEDRKITNYMLICVLCFVLYENQTPFTDFMFRYKHLLVLLNTGKVSFLRRGISVQRWCVEGTVWSSSKYKTISSGKKYEWNSMAVRVWEGNKHWKPRKANLKTSFNALYM